MNPSALVVGAGIAGITTALSLSSHGFPVHLVERTGVLGGNAVNINQTYQGEPVQKHLEHLIDEVASENNITVHLNTKVSHVAGFVGNFKTDLISKSSETIIDHGVVILATGAKESKPNAYLYGKHDSVVTQLEMDALFRDKDPRIDQAQDVAFIQCVGSRDETHPYCSKVCCTHSIKTALAFKRKNPKSNVYVFYRDIRTYGKREALYHEARAKGVLFFRYFPEEKPVVQPDGKRIRIDFRDHILGSKLSVQADILCLATAIESEKDQELIQSFKVPVDEDGWLLEAHQKLRPVDFANDGIFLCGMAHYPKPIEESIAQAKAAASRAVTYLAMDQITVGGFVSEIDTRFCSGCLACINVCPYQAISFNSEKKVAEVNPALCKGCGACAAACPSEAPVLMGFNNRQLLAQIKSALAA
jgi:heterodisulfide reductase subunit A